LGHHELLILLLQLALLLMVARILGAVIQRFGQPQVVGELLAGVLLGPSLLGWLWPQFQAQIFPHSQPQADLLAAISWLGVLFLLVVTGLETDLNLIIRKGRTALVISLGGIVLPFATGIALGWHLPDSFVAHPDQRLVFSLFIATAMSISAIPVIAKVLIDLKLIRRDIGQLTLAAGMTDDTIGWILLSVVAGLATSGNFGVEKLLASVLAAVIFLALAFTLGRMVVSNILRWVDNLIGGVAANLSTILVLALATSALTHALGLEAALGAFVIGILVGQAPRFNRQAGHTLELITTSFLAPIFFAGAGLKVDLLQMLNPTTLIVGLVVLVVACVGKFAGAYLGARLGRLSHWEGIALGSGMNARGAMEIIVATIGLSLGVLNAPMYSIIVMVAIVTSLMAPPLLRWSLSKVVIGPEESQRLKSEALASQSFIKKIRRVLVPSRGGHNIQAAAQLVGYLAHQNPLEVMVLSVSPTPTTASPKSDLAIVKVTHSLRLPQGNTAKTKSLVNPKTVEAILQEAEKGYDLIVLGASESKFPVTTLFNQLVDQVVQNAPCATLVVKSPVHDSSHDPILHPPEPSTDAGEASTTLAQLRHILVPSTGSESSTYAVEIAAALAAQTDAVVTLLNVVHAVQTQPWNEPSWGELALQILNQQAELGRSLGAKVKTEVLQGNPEQRILRYADQHQVDLIVLGSNARPTTGRAFLGQRVDAILSRAHCPVAVISASR
jgi:Kef-type K+ transport system membrane component KefB